jgi:hypothetical protein
LSVEPEYEATVDVCNTCGERGDFNAEDADRIAALYKDALNKGISLAIETDQTQNGMFIARIVSFPHTIGVGKIGYRTGKRHCV